MACLVNWSERKSRPHTLHRHKNGSDSNCQTTARQTYAEPIVAAIESTLVLEGVARVAVGHNDFHHGPPMHDGPYVATILIPAIVHLQLHTCNGLFLPDDKRTVSMTSLPGGLSYIQNGSRTGQAKVCMQSLSTDPTVCSTSPSR